MSKLFNISNMFSENAKFSSFASENPVNACYFENTLSILETFNSDFNKLNKDLYVRLNEAEEKAQENDILCDYFKQVEALIQDFINKANEQTSRFVITIDNIVDANQGLVSSKELISNFKPFTYRYYKFKNISNPNFPQMNPLTVYKKEFDFIGQLLQDLGPASSNLQKLQAIAIVYNKLHEVGDSKSFAKKCIKDIVDCDSDDCMESFAKDLYEEFKDDDPEDVVISKSVMYDIKLSLANYKTLENAGVATAENLIKQFSEIAEDIKTIICGNDKNTLKIDTKTDGIKNTTYKLDTYGMNQVDLFLKAKINQIATMVNIYAIALSIKLDAISDYFDQCKDILAAAEMASVSDHEDIDDGASGDSDDTIASTGDEEEPVEDGGEDEPETDDDEESEDDSDDDDEENSEDKDSNDDDESEDEPESEEEPEEETPAESEEEVEPEPVDQDEEDLKDAEAQTEAMIRQYQYEYYLLNTVYENVSLLESIIDIVDEAEGDDNAGGDNAGGGDAGNTAATQTIGKAKDLVNKANTPIWKTLVNKMAELWNKFKTNVTTMYNQKIKYLDDNKKYFAMKQIDFSPENHKLMPKYRPENLQKIKLPDLNYDSLVKGGKLRDESTFFETFGIPRKDGISINQAVKNYIAPEDEYYQNMNDADLKPDKLYAWCKAFPKLIDEIQKMTNVIEAGRRNADNVAKKVTGESASLKPDAKTIAMSYFSEAINTKADENDPKNNNDNQNVTNNLKVYFKVCGDVLTGCMTCAQKIFNDYYSLLKFHIKKSGGGENKNNSEDNNNRQNDAGGDVQFNN